MGKEHHLYSSRNQEGFPESQEVKKRSQVMRRIVIIDKALTLVRCLSQGCISVAAEEAFLKSMWKIITRQFQPT
jgi:hypothetical protein